MPYNNSVITTWLNPLHLKEYKIEEHSKIFPKNKPFQYLKLKDFFKEEKVKALLEALKTERFGFRESDLYTFFQTNDFVKTKNKVLQEFRAFLCSAEFISYIERITGQKLKENSIDMSASAYEKTHYLLPHDDQVEGRRIAYSFYFTSLDEENGGALALYSSKEKKPAKIVERIMPTKNMFVIFLVSAFSFHEVEEVITDKQRLAISGWFHHD